MKKVLFGIFIIILGISIYSFIMLNNVITDNNNLKSKINTVNSDNSNLEKDNETKETKIDNLKTELKDRLEEKEIWEKAKEKLTSALS